MPGGDAAAGRTAGITGLVYRSVRGVTKLVGGSVDALLGLLPAVAQPIQPSPRREALVGALNGVLGDHLLASHNPLATPMTLRRDGRALDADSPAPTGGTAIVLIHGLCMNELQWRRDGHDHGVALAQSLGVTPLYLRYNSGLHVSANGQDLSRLLQRRFGGGSSTAPQRLVLLGHSMGGLVARSALHHAGQAGHTWPALVTDLVCLGTPHHGAPLERAGHWVELILGAAPYAKPMARLARVRSAGITDLRHGNLLDADWQGLQSSPARSRKDLRQPVPLPSGIRCYAIAGTTGEQPGDLQDHLLGDGLVPLASALGQHKSAAQTLAFAPQRQWVATRTGHLQLLSSPAVLERLRSWLAAG